MADTNPTWLWERMRSFGDAKALVWQNKVATYTQLLSKKDAWAQELKKRGVTQGSVVLIEGSLSPEACALLLALIDVGAIAVPLTPELKVHRAEFDAVAEVQFAFSFDQNDGHQAAQFDRTVTHALYQKLLSRGRPGLVIFSSGSVGKPKAVLHDFGALLEKFRPQRTRKCTLSFLLFDHIGGIDTLFNTLSNGGTLVTVPKRDPETVAAAIAAHGVHTLPASPTFLNLLLVSEAFKRYDLSSLKLIAYGTEAMPEVTLRRLKEALPDVQVVQTYGTSELGVLRSGGSGAKDKGALWLKFSDDGFQTKIVDGVLWVKSPTAMLGYLNAPDLFDADGWLNTQDAVEVDGPYVRIIGRVTDLINVGGQKVYPAEVEGVLLTMENVHDAVVYGEKNPLTGHIVAAKVKLIQPEPLDQFKKRLRAHCKGKLAAYKIPVRIELTEEDSFGARFKKMRPRSAPPAGNNSNEGAKP